MHFLQFNSAISKRSLHTLRVELGEKAMRQMVVYKRLKTMENSVKA